MTRRTDDRTNVTNFSYDHNQIRKTLNIESPLILCQHLICLNKDKYKQTKQKDIHLFK